jgi:hypothetical protein
MGKPKSEISNVKICIACGMPMIAPEDFVGGDRDCDYCNFCARPDGSMQTFAEKRASLVSFIVRSQGIDKTVARAVAELMMKKLPAWEKHYAKK